jgi:hypothetical protein
MKKSVSVKDFTTARDHMEYLVVDTMNKMELGIYDPWLKYLFEVEVKNMINNEFKTKYPGIDVSFNFSVHILEHTIEYSVQRYYHPFSQHIFMGSIRDPIRGRGLKEPYLVDCYYSTLYEAMGEPRIIVRYGHTKKEMEEGGGSVAHQFYNGVDNILTKAYQLAIECGYVQG